MRVAKTSLPQHAFVECTGTTSPWIYLYFPLVTTFIPNKQNSTFLCRNHHLLHVRCSLDARFARSPPPVFISRDETITFIRDMFGMPQRKEMASCILHDKQDCLQARGFHLRHRLLLQVPTQVKYIEDWGSFGAELDRIPVCDAMQFNIDTWNFPKNLLPTLPGNTSEMQLCTPKY